MSNKPKFCSTSCLVGPCNKVSKLIAVFLNGSNSHPIVINVGKHKWHHVLNEITCKLFPYFGLVKRLFTSKSGSSIHSFTDLENYGSYVASNHKNFLKLKGGYKIIKENNTHFFEHYTPRDLTRKNESKRLINCRKDLLVIYVFLNGNKFQPAQKFVFNPEDLHNWDHALSYIALLVDCPKGAIKSLYTLNGNIVCGPWELQHGASYVAVGYSENFIKCDYKVHDKTTEIWKSGSPVVQKDKLMQCIHVENWREKLKTNYLSKGLYSKKQKKVENKTMERPATVPIIKENKGEPNSGPSVRVSKESRGESREDFTQNTNNCSSYSLNRTSPTTTDTERTSDEDYRYNDKKKKKKKESSEKINTSSETTKKIKYQEDYKTSSSNNELDCKSSNIVNREYIYLKRRDYPKCTNKVPIPVQLYRCTCSSCPEKVRETMPRLYNNYIYHQNTHAQTDVSYDSNKIYKHTQHKINNKKNENIHCNVCCSCPKEDGDSSCNICKKYEKCTCQCTKGTATSSDNEQDETNIKSTQNQLQKEYKCACSECPSRMIDKNTETKPKEIGLKNRIKSAKQSKNVTKTKKTASDKTSKVPQKKNSDEVNKVKNILQIDTSKVCTSNEEFLENLQNLFVKCICNECMNKLLRETQIPQDKKLDSTYDSYLQKCGKCPKKNISKDLTKCVCKECVKSVLNTTKTKEKTIKRSHSETKPKTQNEPVSNNKPQTAKAATRSTKPVSKRPVTPKKVNQISSSTNKTTKQINKPQPKSQSKDPPDGSNLFDYIKLQPKFITNENNPKAQCENINKDYSNYECKSQQKHRVNFVDDNCTKPKHCNNLQNRNPYIGYCFPKNQNKLNDQLTKLRSILHNSKLIKQSQINKIPNISEKIIKPSLKLLKTEYNSNEYEETSNILSNNQNQELENKLPNIKNLNLQFGELLKNQKLAKNLQTKNTESDTSIMEPERETEENKIDLEEKEKKLSKHLDLLTSINELLETIVTDIINVRDSSRKNKQ